MADPVDLTDSIATNAQGPKRAQNDSGSMEQHSLPDQIEADKYMSAKAGNRKGLGIRFLKIVPPGASGVDRR